VLVRQYLAAFSHALPAGEPVEAVAAIVLWFGIVVVLRRERLERPIVGCVFDGDHVFAEGVAVDVMQAHTCHQFFGHIVDGDKVLVFCGVLVALVSDFNESRGIDVEGEPLSLCAFLCRLVSFKGCR
jgi:hypothetical protein